MANQINIQVGADIKNFQAGITQAVQTMKDAGQDMSAVSESVSRLTTNGFKTISQAYRQTSKDAETLALHLGTDSEAFKQAAGMAQVYGNQLQEVRSKIAGVDLGKTAVGVQKATSSFNGLGNSINQLTREMPAFTYSVQTGFMALSNNIPIFVDQIMALKQANLALAASGQPVQSVFSQVTSALFSWNTALSVGITALTVFSPMIADYIANFNESADATRKAADELKKFNLEHQKYIASGEQREVIQAETDYNSVSKARKIELAIINERIKIAKQFNQEISQADLDRQKQLNLELKQEYEAYQKNLSDIRKKYAAKEKADAIATSREIAMAKQTDSRLESGLGLNNLAAGALGDKVQQSITEGWANINAKNLKGMADFKANWDGFIVTTQEVALRVGDVVNSMTNTLASGIEAAIGAANRGGDVGKALTASLLGSMGQFMKQWGSQLILVGIGAEALKKSLLTLNGVGAIIAGGALIAAGAVASSMASNFASSGGNNYSGGNNFNGNVGGGYSPFTPSFSGSSQYLMLDSRVRGTDIIISADNQRRQNRRVR